MSASTLLSRLSLVAGATLALVALTPFAAYAESVKGMLGGYHFSGSVDELSAKAGSKEALITELLSLRRDTKTPFVAVRAEKVLLELAGDTRVRTALEEDATSKEFLGLARTVAVHIDKVEDTGVRRALAGSLLKRSDGDKSISKILQESKDPEISAAARSAE